MCDLKDGVWDLMIEFIGNLVATIHKSLSDWTLATSDHTTPPTELTALYCTACQSQSQSDFMTGGLLPISSPWRQAL
jgi:hypothetical protein